MEKIEEVVYYVLKNMAMISTHGSGASLDSDMPLYTNAYNMYAYYFGCLDFHKDNNRIQQKQRMNEQHARQGERRDRRTEDDEAVHVRPRTSTVCTEHVRPLTMSQRRILSPRLSRRGARCLCELHPVHPRASASSSTISLPHDGPTQPPTCTSSGGGLALRQPKTARASVHARSTCTGIVNSTPCVPSERACAETCAPCLEWGLTD